MVLDHVRTLAVVAVVASPTARRKLGIELKALRGRVVVRPVTLKALLQACRAGVDVTARLTQTAADTTKRGYRGWWQPYAAAISEKYATLIAFESETTSIEAFAADLYPEAVGSYSDVFNRLAQDALSNDNSADLLRVDLLRHAMEETRWPV